MTRTQLARLLDLPSDAPVRIHTYQHGAALTVAERSGTLDGDAGHASYPEAYAWMRDRMAEMVTGFSGAHPVWAWLRRPDGRVKVLDRYADMVRITAIVPRGRIVVSDLNMWHCVMNEQHANLDLAEMEAYEAIWPDEPRIGHPEFEVHRQAMHGSWMKVFQPLAPPDHDLWGDRSRIPVQACVDGIRMDEIVSVRRYGALPPHRHPPCDNDTHP